MRSIVLFLCFVLSFHVQAVTPPNGAWRGEFHINEDPVPFNFEIGKDKNGAQQLVLVNGSRRDIYALLDAGQGEWRVPLGTFNAELRLRFREDGALDGEFHNLTSNRQAFDLPFTAHQDRRYRFVPAQAQTTHDAAGKWRIDVLTKRPSPHQVAELRQEGNRVTGVLLTTVGDSRELEGNIIGDELFLSTFTGPAPVYLRGRITPAGELEGTLSFGAFVTLKFNGVRDPGVELPDAFDLTKVVDRDAPLVLTLPDLDGASVSLADPRFEDKVVIVQVLGTWCPNCVDESRFLEPWYRANRHRGVEVVGVAFEAEDSFEAARPALEIFRKQLGVTYPLLYGGSLDKVEASARFPQIEQVLAYPTTIFLDRQGRIHEVHAGFSGQDTGSHYDAFVHRFEALVDALLDDAPATAHRRAPESGVGQ